jgi:hypothetical protein
VPDSPGLVLRKASLRSKVTNGVRVFAVGGDGRSQWTRRWRDLVELHASDCGGADTISEAKLSLCRRVAAIEVQLELMEARMSEGVVTDAELDLYNRLSGNLRRILESLGLERVAKPVNGPLTLAEISARIKAGRQSVSPL